MVWTTIAAQISQATGLAFQPSRPTNVGGGCINQGYQLVDGQRQYFVKLNRADRVSMFSAEALGLQHMQATQTIRVPTPICWGIADSQSFIVLEWLALGRGSGQAWAEMGRQLAKLHQVSNQQAKKHRYGWDQDNTIGSTPQINSWRDDWATFYRDCRLGYQVQLAQQQGGYFPRHEQLLAAIPELLADHQPAPSLLHGDLWSGNAAITQAGEPTIFDPATYWGDRETDMAMTELFGGFPPEFYQHYNQTLPLDPGYQHRKLLYNLYHILNHFNLFGGGYEAQANRMIDQLLR